MGPTGRRRIGLWLGGLMLCGACRTPPADPQDPVARERLLALLMPSSIEIVTPFTRVAPVADGSEAGDMDLQLELLLRASNALDNPGLMVVGNVRVELYQHRSASGEAKGRQLVRWVVPLQTEDDQRTYWNPVTQMYEIRLGLKREQIPGQDRYVVQVTYNSPLGSHLSDEAVIEVARFRRAFAPSTPR